MDIREIMYGNWITSKSSGFAWQVYIDDFKYIFDNPNHYDPIPLTEEWLIKFRFHHREFSFDKGSFFLMKRTGKNEYLYQAHTKRFQIKYVHQLQNLYFALTGEQLTVKP